MPRELQRTLPQKVTRASEFIRFNGCVLYFGLFFSVLEVLMYTTFVEVQ